MFQEHNHSLTDCVIFCGCFSLSFLQFDLVSISIVYNLISNTFFVLPLELLHIFSNKLSYQNDQIETEVILYICYSTVGIYHCA